MKFQHTYEFYAKCELGSDALTHTHFYVTLCVYCTCVCTPYMTIPIVGKWKVHNKTIWYNGSTQMAERDSISNIH